MKCASGWLIDMTGIGREQKEKEKKTRKKEEEERRRDRLESKVLPTRTYVLLDCTSSLL